MTEREQNQRERERRAAAQGWQWIIFRDGKTVLAYNSRLRLCAFRDDMEQVLEYIEYQALEYPEEISKEMSNIRA